MGTDLDQSGLLHGVVGRWGRWGSRGARPFMYISGDR